MQFGEHLKAERERRGISLKDVSVSTRVSMRHLQALEDDQYKELPGGVFNRGIVRSYAQHCGLDVESTVESFTQAMKASGFDTEQRDDDWVQFAEAVRRSRAGSASRRRWQWAGVAAMVFAVIALLGGLAWLLVSKDIVHLPAKHAPAQQPTDGQDGQQETQQDSQ